MTTTLATKLALVDDILNQLGNKTGKLSATAEGLQTSLEYSQHEIDELKTENKKLKQRVTDMELEEDRSKYHLDKLDDKIDRIKIRFSRGSLKMEETKK